MMRFRDMLFVMVLVLLAVTAFDIAGHTGKIATTGGWNAQGRALMR